MRQIAKILTVIILLLAGLCIFESYSSHVGGALERRSLFLQGRDRTYFVHFPPNRSAMEAKPVVFASGGEKQVMIVQDVA